MSEIALRTSERKLQRGNILHWRPVGSTIVCISNSMRIRKWLEICCDLVSPKKRKDYESLPAYDKLCEAWTPELRETWLIADRPTKDYPLGQLLMDNSYPQKLWDELIEPLGVLKDLPLAPESDVLIYNTWLWSETERKQFYIVSNTDATDEEVESWQGTEERVDGLNTVIAWKKQIKYQTELGLSQPELDKIANPDIVVHPKFDAPVPKIKIVQPNLAGSRITVR